MENKYNWTWNKFYAFPFEVYSGAKEFWEPGYDYDDPDFWSNYPEQDPDLILAVRMYDHLMTIDMMVDDFLADGGEKYDDLIVERESTRFDPDIDRWVLDAHDYKYDCLLVVEKDNNITIHTLGTN